MSKYISITEAAEILGVTPKTLRVWDKEGVLKSYKTPKGHRRYLASELEEYLGNHNTVKKSEYENKVYIYSRVSTKKQYESGNLKRQTDRLSKYCEEKKYSVVNTFEEVASGINENRPKLKKMLGNLDKVEKIVVEYPDRLARFGLEYIKIIASQNNVDIEFLEDNENSSTNEEMAKDIISIITCFSAKLYGARGGRKVKKILNELSKE
ncbi:IS607 family transposase [Clostridium perfringens]